VPARAVVRRLPGYAQATGDFGRRQAIREQALADAELAGGRGDRALDNVRGGGRRVLSVYRAVERGADAVDLLRRQAVDGGAKRAHRLVYARLAPPVRHCHFIPLPPLVSDAK